MKIIIANQHERVGLWACNILGATFNKESSVCFGLEEDGELIAGVIFDNYRVKSIAMHVAAIGKRWLCREFLWACFDYPFRQLNVNKVIGYVSEDNLDAQRFDEHLGFTIEAIIKDADQGGDVLIYTMTKEQCRFLEIKHG